MFLEDTKVEGLLLPEYGNFPEVNLRFNAKDKDGEFNGVVFIKELVPGSLVSAAANTFFNEKYETKDVRSEMTESNDVLKFKYSIDDECVISAVTEKRTVTTAENSIKHMLKQRNAGFGVFNGKTIIYKVEHGLWEVYPVLSYACNLRFDKIFGSHWMFLNDKQPFDVTVAKGSIVNVYEWDYYKY